MAFDMSDYLDGQVKTVAKMMASLDNSISSTDDEDMTNPTKDEMKSALEASEARVDVRLANFDSSVKTGFAELRTSFAELRTDMATQNGHFQTQMAEMRAEMHKGTVDIIKWVIGVGLASIGAMFTVSKMTDKPPTSAATQPAPIIITIPDAATPQIAPVPAPLGKK